MASQNNLSNAASIVAVKKEYDANTDDDEVELSVADEIIASEVASSMVAVKKEYDANTDDEVELFVADEMIASEVASPMVAVKTEYDADTDDEEQQQQPNKKTKRDDNEHEKHIAEIRKITDQLLSPGRRHDATVLKQIRQIARDLESFSNELNQSANDVEKKLVNAQTPEQRKERKRFIQLHMTLLLHASTCRSQECSANCAKMKGLLKHRTTCKVKVKGGCDLCKRIQALLQIHAKQCKQENCPVQHCMAIREHYRQLRSQQQAG